MSTTKPIDKRATTRKHGRHLRVPVLPAEATQIEQHAKAAALSVAAYLRAVGLGHEVKSRVDLASLQALSKINADQGRLGGLLKMWLTNDERLAQHDPGQLRASILAVLDRIRETQAALLQAAKRL